MELELDARESKVEVEEEEEEEEVGDISVERDDEGELETGEEVGDVEIVGVIEGVEEDSKDFSSRENETISFFFSNSKNIQRILNTLPNKNPTGPLT
jgi:hypothetical protein